MTLRRLASLLVEPVGSFEISVELAGRLFFTQFESGTQIEAGLSPVRDYLLVQLRLFVLQAQLRQALRLILLLAFTRVDRMGMSAFAVCKMVVLQLPNVCVDPDRLWCLVAIETQVFRLVSHLDRLPRHLEHLVWFVFGDLTVEMSLVFVVLI